MTGHYLPRAIRKMDIQKPDGGVRTLGIPTVSVWHGIGEYHSFYSFRYSAGVAVAAYADFVGQYHWSRDCAGYSGAGSTDLR